MKLISILAVLGKQVKLSHLGHRKPARIYWKANDTSHGLVRILVQKHNFAILLRKWTIRGRYSQWRSLSGHVEQVFVHKNWRGGYLISAGRRYVPHSRSYIRCFAPCFWRSHYQPQSWCRWATSELRFDTVGLLFVGWSVSPTSQRQLTLQRTIFVKPLVKYSCTQSIMCLKIVPIE